MDDVKLIFQCRYCRETFEEPVDESLEPIDPEHIGCWSQIVSTHKCTADGSIHGCAELIGIRKNCTE